MPRVLFDVSGLVQWYAFLSNPSGIQRVMESLLGQPALLGDPAVTLVSRAIGSDRFYVIDPEIIADLATPSTRRAAVARLRGLFAASMRLADPVRLLREMRPLHTHYAAFGFSFTERLWESYSAGRWVGSSRRLQTIAAGESYDALVGLGDFWCHEGHVAALIDLKQRSGATLVHLVHDLIAVMNPQWAHPHYGRLLVEQLDRLAPAVDHWLVTSSYVGGQLATYLDRRRLPSRPVDTISMGWPDAQTSGNDTGILARHGLEKERYLLHVGTVEPRKNLEGLFDALANLRDDPTVSGLPCVLAGRDGWRSDAVRLRLKNDPWLAGRVKWIRDASDRDLVTLYRRARFTVVPSFDEGWGLAVQESLAHGTPCLAARVGGIPEAGLDLADYVEGNGTESLTRAIRLLASDDQAIARSRARIADRLAAASLPSWRDSANRLGRLLGIGRPDTPAG